VSDPSKLYGDVAKAWTVSPDGKTYSFELKPDLKFASGNDLTAEDVVFSLQRAVLLDKTPAFILTQFGFSKANVKDKIKQTGPLTLTIETEKSFAPSFVLNCLTANVAAIVDKKLVLSKEQNRRLGLWLAQDQLRRLRPLEAARVARQRNRGARAQRQLLRREIEAAARHLSAREGGATQRLLLEKSDCRHRAQSHAAGPAALAANKDIKTTSTPKGTVYYFSLNQKNPILAKAEVREAMKWLVDYSAIGDTLIKNIGVVHQNFLPVGLLGASTENPYKLDVDKAKALLAKAGTRTASRSRSTCARCSRCRASRRRSSRRPSARASTSRSCPATASRR
jgi:peptide/nickel transport system substrate-binding protein